MSYMKGAGIQRWELTSLNDEPIQTFLQFKGRLLEYFEPVNIEMYARRTFGNLNQIGKFNDVRD